MPAMAARFWQIPPLVLPDKIKPAELAEDALASAVVDAELPDTYSMHRRWRTKSLAGICCTMWVLTALLLPPIADCLPSPENLSRELRSQQSSCKMQPHHHAAFGKWASKPNDTHQLSMMVPSLHHLNFRTMSEAELKAGAVLAGATECPNSPASSLDEPIMGRSLCPWYWKINYSATRLPAMLPEAVCRCRRAVTGVNGVVHYECQPLTMQIRVLELDADCREYSERTIEVAVACVSVVQSAVRLNKLPGIQSPGYARLRPDI